MIKKTLLFFVFTQGLCMGNMHYPKNITAAVFCSGNNNIAPHLKTAAYELGQYLGANHYGLTTGGGDIGLMKEISDGYISQATSLKKFQGVILQAHSAYHHPVLPEENIILVQSLHDRLDHFYCTADIFIVLPGGFGTLHELADCLVHSKRTKKTIILINIDGFWNHLIQQFNAIITSNPAASQHLASCVIVNTVSECTELLNTEAFSTIYPSTSTSAITGK